MAQPIDYDDLVAVSTYRHAEHVPGIRVVWPDREHAVIGVTGAASGPHWLEELRERVQALLAGGVRYLLVDLSDATCRDEAMVGVLTDAAPFVQQRDGWLRIHRSGTGEPSASPAVAEVTLPDLFAIYRALGPQGEP